jgi:hypothetical protein
MLRHLRGLRRAVAVIGGVLAVRTDEAEMHMRAVAHRVRRGLGREGGAIAMAPRHFADHFARQHGAVAGHGSGGGRARHLILVDAVFRLDGLRFEPGGFECLRQRAGKAGRDAHRLQRERRGQRQVGAGEQELVLEGRREAQARLRLEIAERLLHEAARAALPVRAVVDVSSRTSGCGRRACPATGPAAPRFRRGASAAPPSWVPRGCPRCRQTASAPGPPRPSPGPFHALRQFGRRHAAAARDADIVAPAEIGDIG